MIIKLKKISLILFILIFFSDTLKSNQIFKDRKVLNKKQQTSSFVSEIGDVYKDTIWKSIFLDKTFDDIDSFIKTIPTKSPNPFIQEMIFDFLTTKKKLNNKNIKLNITAVYTAKQTAKILKVINKKTKVIISIFAGRAADAGKDPIPEIIKSIKLSKKFKNVEILWASVREPYNYLQAKQLGCHIITIPPSIIDKIENFGKSFSYLTIDTVKKFLEDSKNSRFKI